MSDLNEDEVRWLKELRDGGLMQRKLPENVERRLLNLGLAEQKLGGTVITGKGRIALGQK